MRVGRLLILGLVLVLLGGSAVAWMERASLRSWWVLRGLKRAGDSDRALWISRVADLGESSVEGLLACLDCPEERARRNAACALNHLAQSWGAADPRTADLAGKLARGYGRLCPEGQACLLEGMAGWLGDDCPSPAFVSACSRLLSESAAGPDEALSGALELAVALLRRPQTSEALRSARETARAGLRSPTASNRLRAVRLGLLPGVDLLDEIAALLRDPDVQVRRAAVLAVGPAEQVVRDEGLLLCLHDHDAEVRRLTEEALKGRGLQPDHLRLGKLLTHPTATQRLRVLDYLADENFKFDTGLWLRRLSHDPSPAVRAAALRMMSQQTHIDLSDRLDQMASSDPSPTVAQLARFYLERKRPGK
jgi:HEAT repeat protein